MGVLLEKLKHAFAIGPDPAGDTPVLPPVLERLAVEIVERGLETPATVVLDAIRPASFLAGQAMHALAPFIKMSGRWDDYEVIAQAFEDRRMVELFLVRIENLAAARDGAGDPW